MEIEQIVAGCQQSVVVHSGLVMGPTVRPPAVLATRSSGMSLDAVSYRREVPVDQTLARVEEDVRAGRHALARQRLRGLVGSLPQRLDLRERLASAYRRDGDLAQAGRWAYLSPDAEPHEVEAFERAYGDDPVLIMRALGWRGSEAEAATAFARDRLTWVRERAEAKAGKTLAWERPRYSQPESSWWDDLLGGLAVLVFLVVAFAVLVGIGSLAAHGLDVILGWFG